MPARRTQDDWATRAAALAGRIPHERLHPATVAWADAASRRMTWGVGLSGGADSVALLLLLWVHWPERRRRLRVLHFDHRLRGRESTADARFCERLCRELGVTFVAGRWERGRKKGQSGGKQNVSEAEARAARLEFFREHARVVWLGHQQDDIAESMLMRLARGSGTGGLAAPRPVQVFADKRVHVRPLLTLKKEEIVAALQDAGVAWREDGSNAGERFLRNRVRHNVVPVWLEAVQRDGLGGAARSRALLDEDDAALEAWTDAAVRLEREPGGMALNLGELAGVPRAVLRRALHRWLGEQRQAVDISSQAFEALLAAIEAGKPTRQSLGAKHFAVISGGVLRMMAAKNLRRIFRRRAN